MVFKNPCKKCIVRSMCKEDECKIKKDFVITYVNLAEILFGVIPITAALSILAYLVLNM